MRPEYDFTKGVRGKYTRAYQSGNNLVLLDPDVAAAFPDAASVNRALRVLAELAKQELPAGGTPQAPHRSPRPRTKAAEGRPSKPQRRRAAG